MRHYVLLVRKTRIEQRGIKSSLALQDLAEFFPLSAFAMAFPKQHFHKSYKDLICPPWWQQKQANRLEPLTSRLKDFLPGDSASVMECDGKREQRL